MISEHPHGDRFSLIMASPLLRERESDLRVACFYLVVINGVYDEVTLRLKREDCLVPWPRFNPEIKYLYHVPIMNT